MKKTLLGVALASSLLFTGVAVGTSDYKFVSTNAVQEQIKVNGGVVRLDPKQGVYLHTNSSHHSVGIKKVYIHPTNGSLVVEQNTSSPVVTTTVLPDETLSEKGITVGLSGGGRVSHIFFYKDGKQLKLHWKSHYKRVASSTANIWFTSITK